MERLFPGATLLDVAHPMPRVVSAVSRHTPVPAIGFCNIAWLGYPGDPWLAGLTDRRTEELDVVTAGLNHFVWLLKIRDRRTGEDLRPRVLDRIARGEDHARRVLARWLGRYGALGVSSVKHRAEYLPREPDLYDQDRPPFHGTPEERRQARQMRGRLTGQAFDAVIELSPLYVVVLTCEEKEMRSLFVISFACMLFTTAWPHADPAQTIDLDGSGSGRIFDGIGGLSAGANSRLLIDYFYRSRSAVSRATTSGCCVAMSVCSSGSARRS